MLWMRMREYRRRDWVWRDAELTLKLHSLRICKGYRFNGRRVIHASTVDETTFGRTALTNYSYEVIEH